MPTSWSGSKIELSLLLPLLDEVDEREELDDGLGVDENNDDDFKKSGRIEEEEEDWGSLLPLLDDDDEEEEVDVEERAA